VLLWLERKLAAKRLLQPTKKSMAVIFTQKSVPKVVKMAKLVVLLLVTLAVSGLVFTVPLVDVFRAALKKLRKKLRTFSESPVIMAGLLKLQISNLL
jgi:hypothetical protein